MRKIIICICLAAVLGGCNNKDIDKRAFVVSLGVDKADKDKVEVSLKIALPTGDPKAGMQFNVVTVKAESIAEAVRIAKSKVEKELDFGHTKAIIIGNEMLKEDIKPVTFWAQRRRDIQMISYVVVGMPDAKSVLSVQPKTERVPASYFINMVGKEGSRSPYVVSEYLFDLQRKMIDFGWDPVLPVVEATKDNLVLNKAALLDDDKIKTILSPDETKMYNLLANHNIKTNFTAMHNGKVKYSMNEETSTASYKIREGKNPVITFNIKMSGTLEEDEVEGYFTREKAKESSKMIEDEVNDKAKKLLKKFQDNQVDPLGFGLRYQGTHWKKSEHEEWIDMYPRIDFRAKTNVDIQSTGAIR